MKKLCVLIGYRTTTYFERRQYSYVRPTLGNTIRPIIGPLGEGYNSTNP